MRECSFGEVSWLWIECLAVAQVVVGLNSNQPNDQKTLSLAQQDMSTCFNSEKVNGSQMTRKASFFNMLYSRYSGLWAYTVTAPMATRLLEIFTLTFKMLIWKKR